MSSVLSRYRFRFSWTFYLGTELGVIGWLNVHPSEDFVTAFQSNCPVMYIDSSCSAFSPSWLLATFLLQPSQWVQSKATLSFRLHSLSDNDTKHLRMSPVTVCLSMFGTVPPSQPDGLPTSCSPGSLASYYLLSDFPRIPD